MTAIIARCLYEPLIFIIAMTITQYHTPCATQLRLEQSIYTKRLDQQRIILEQICTHQVLATRTSPTERESSFTHIRTNVEHPPHHKPLLSVLRFP